MYYLQSRYYDPEICRFINADSTDYLGATGTLLSYNLFAYCENDGVNAVDYEGNYLFYVFGKNRSNEKIRSYARELMRSPNIPEFFQLRYSSTYPNGLKLPNYVYVTTKQYKKYKKINVTYDSYLVAGTRVIGTFYYKTIKQWEAWILSKNTPALLKYRDKIIELAGMNEYDYEAFMNTLGEATLIEPISGLVEYYSVIEFALEVIQKYRNPTDRYLIDCLKNIKHQYGDSANKYYVMFYWSVTYKNAVQTTRGITWKNRKYINIYDVF